MTEENKEVENISDQFKNKSSWIDSFFGKIRTDQPDNYYENLQTKVSIKFNKNKKFLFVLKKLYRIYYNIKGPFHMLPDFLILGPGACGTTSLVELYLRSNENIFPSKNNEIFFFDIHYDKSVNWYKVFFPHNFLKIFRKFLGKKTLTCEATGNYIFHPYAPKRIKEIIPNAKFILMMRNPVDRTFSHYRRQVRRGRQTLSFEDALENELKIFDEEFERFENDENLSEDIAPTASYLARSRYVEAIERWLKFFPKKQFLFINSDEYFKDPVKEYNRILEFLNLPPHHPTIKGQRGISPPNLYKNIQLKSETKKFLIDYFKSWNEKLYQLIGRDFEWNK